MIIKVGVGLTIFGVNCTQNALWEVTKLLGNKMFLLGKLMNGKFSIAILKIYIYTSLVGWLVGIVVIVCEVRD